MKAPNKRWTIILKGHKFDLTQWVEAFPVGFDPSAERRGDMITVWASELQTAKDSQEAHELGNLLLARLSGLMRALRHASPLALDAVVETDNNGVESRYVFVTFAAHGRSLASAVSAVVRADGTIEEPKPSVTEEQRYANIALSNLLISDALTYLNNSTNWFELYKAFECVKKLVEPATLNSLDWTTTSELRRFTQTANAIYRHREGAFAPPDDPMTKEEAADFVANLIRHVIESEASKILQARLFA